MRLFQTIADANERNRPHAGGFHSMEISESEPLYFAILVSFAAAFTKR